MARCVFVLVILAAGCGSPTAGPERAGPVPVEVERLHNVYRLSDRLYSGSGPEGDAGFSSLQTLGVKTVITVDGAAPDVARAERFGMRYVHVPVGYDGIPREEAWRLAKAARDLPGPVYVHCHHGMHRGPAAAVVRSSDRSGRPRRRTSAARRRAPRPRRSPGRRRARGRARSGTRTRGPALTTPRRSHRSPRRSPHPSSLDPKFLVLECEGRAFRALRTRVRSWGGARGWARFP